MRHQHGSISHFKGKILETCAFLRDCGQLTHCLYPNWNCAFASDMIYVSNEILPILGMCELTSGDYSTYAYPQLLGVKHVAKGD